jgi:hypothetical protein
MSLACAQVASTMFYLPEVTNADRDLLEAASYRADGAALESCDPYALIARAGAGDIASQRQAADMILLWVLGKNDPTPLATLREGLVLARLAASRGDSEDITRLIYMLSYAGMICPAEELNDFAAEMLALVGVMADRGHEPSATLLAAVAEHETPATMAEARDRAKRITTAWGLT